MFILIVFIISLVITLNIFFQQSYQSEMAEQFNRQQLLIAKSVAKNIEDDMQHFEETVLSFSRLLGDRGLHDGSLGSFVDNGFPEIRENININIKIFDEKGHLRYSSFSETVTPDDRELLVEARRTGQGRVLYRNRLIAERKLVLAAPVMRAKEQRGVLIIEMMIESINKKFLAPMRAGIRGHAWMMDGDGTLLYHPTQPKMVGKNLYQADSSCFECHQSFEVEKKILESGELGFSSYIAPYGEDKLVAFSKARVADMSWIICVSIPYSEVTFSIRKSMRVHSLLVISIFLATVSAAFAIILINRQRIKAEEKTIHLETQQSLEKEIVATKDYLENVLESTESKIMVLDRALRVKTINSAHERMCGLRKDDVEGRGFFDVFPVATEKEREGIREHLQTCLEGVSHRVSNYPYRRGDQDLYLNININPLILHGEVSGIILSSSDVTEEVALKEELRNYAANLQDIVKERTDELFTEKEKLNSILETLEAGLFVVDEKKKIVWVNRTLREWLGEMSPDRITLDTIYGGGSIQRAIVDNRVMQEVIYREFERRRGYFQVTSSPLDTPDGNVQTLVLIQDITDMKKMEEQMMHSEKLSALSRISAGVAHEIGNPLTSISSYIQILREMDFDDFTRESLETIARQINRITDIVRQMSGFSRTKGSELKPHTLSELVDLTLDLIRYDKRMKHIAVTKDVPADLPGIMVDETQLIQVFMNIILNAADAMGNGGSLAISAGRDEKELEVSFADTGSGISEENREKIFDPFFTTKETGTGLGLSVSYSIIKSYKGDILVEPRPGGGTIFRVRLPYYES